MRTNKGKEFIIREFQGVLKSESIQFQVCKNSDVNCSVVERAHRTIKNRIYKYFTYKNIYSEQQHGSLCYGHGAGESERFRHSRYTEQDAATFASAR